MASELSETDDEEGARLGALEIVWSDWRFGVAIALVLSSGFAIATSQLTPRGPITSTQALVGMASAGLVGAVAGLAMANRWSAAVTVITFVGIFELGRIDVAGPTVDAIHLDAFLGIVAFVLGRLLHALLVLVPMIVGCMYGVWAAQKIGGPDTAQLGSLGRWSTIAATVALLALGVAIARPASTTPVFDEDGEPMPGSIAELVTVDINGHDQTLMIRSRSQDNPVLLYLAGGPGGTDIGAMRRDVGLEQDFIVVTWDQRGAGKSYAAIDPIETLTVQSLVEDTIELTHYLRERFGVEKVYLVGQSWGSTLGVLAAQEQPQLYHAFVGVGQMVSQRLTDIMAWEDAITWAEESDNRALAEELRRNGPPPYADVLLYDPVVSTEHQWNPYPELDLDNEMPAILFVPELTFMDRVNAFRGFLDTNGSLYPQLQNIDFRFDAPKLDLPVYMVLGDHETRGRSTLANEWFAALEAPAKRRFIFEGAGHRANFDKPAEFVEVMNQVLLDTQPTD